MKSINSQTNEGHLSHFSFTHTPSHELIIPFQNILLLLQQIDNYKDPFTFCIKENNMMESSCIIFCYNRNINT